MINLIPPSAQKEVKREYWTRVVSVWILLLASACVLLAVLCAPVYVLVQSQLDAFSQEYTQASLENESFAKSEAAIKRGNAIAALLTQAEEDTTFSSVIEELEKTAGAQVQIVEFTLARTDGKLQPIVIKGVAESRLALTTFSEALETHVLFADVQLPLSNLAQNENVEFSLTVTHEVPQEAQ